jgi:aspartate aminotransferase
MHPPYNQAMQKVRLSPIVGISEEVRRLAPAFQKETGQQFVLFQRGEIDRPTPTYIVEALTRALAEGRTHYPKSGGEDILKDAILEKLRDWNGVDGIGREHVVVTCGGQEALELAFMLFRGQRGAGFAPLWSCVLENFIPYTDVQFTEVPLSEGFSLDIAALEGALKQSTFFYLNTPHNPTGKVFTEVEVRTVVDLCRHYGVTVIADEAYESILYETASHFSPTAIAQAKLMGAFTFSKTFAMTGWRIGYLVCRDAAVANLIRLGNYSQTAGIPTFIQYAAAEALTNRPAAHEALKAMRQECQRRRETMAAGLSTLPGVAVTLPQGGFYFFPNFSKLIPRDLNEAERSRYVFEKLMRHGVATVYGSCFGAHFRENLRFSFSYAPVPAITEWIARVARALAS